MLHCQNCESHNVRWFTPHRYASRAAVLLCMNCRHLTIVPPRVGREPAAAQVKQAA